MPVDLGFIRGHRLDVYTATWCPDCAQLARWLAANEVAHEKVDIDRDAGAAEKIERETGKRAVPFILVDGATWVRGYHRERPTRFDPALLVSELRHAVAPPR